MDIQYSHQIKGYNSNLELENKQNISHTFIFP